MFERTEVVPSDNNDSIKQSSWSEQRGINNGRVPGAATQHVHLLELADWPMDILSLPIHASCFPISNLDTLP